MTEKDFIESACSYSIEEGKVSESAPSNIALVKYWGKYQNQIPANPSISFTLQNSKTLTSICFKKREKKQNDFSFDFLFEGKEKPDFHPKILTFFERIVKYVPFLKNYHFEISSKNTFPHSSGIASSASSMAALSLGIIQIERKLYQKEDKDYFWRKASFLARLGSGSACRSVYQNIVVWGTQQQIKNSSDLYATPYPYKVHPIFKNYQDTILLIDKGQKKVSSSVGHSLMKNHPFAKERFAQAHRNIDTLIPIFKEGNLIDFIKIAESEALTLHAMMMSSNPYFILMKPNTLQVIEKIWEYREQTKTPICFTLDAGANVHVLYPEKYKNECMEFIKNELVVFCENKHYLCDSLSSF